MNFNLKTITAPTAEPITLDEAKAQCRVDIADDDALIGALITAAREEVERQSYHALMTQTLEMILTAWPYDHPILPGWYTGHIRLPRPPLQSVTSVTYKDYTGTVRTMTVNTDYVVAGDSIPAEVMPPYAKTWPPVVLHAAEPIRVRYVCGYADAASVPDSLKLAVKLLVGHWYENREASNPMLLRDIPRGVDALCMSYRMKAKVWG